MKKYILILLLIVASDSVFAQSGTLLPNGFQIPRVASLATCNTNAKGTMVFLTTDNKLYICNGAAWQGPSEFSIPYSTTASSNAGGLFNLTNSGTSWVMNTAISNIFNNANTIISFTAGTGSAGYFYTSNVNGHAFKTYGALNFDNIGHADGKVLTSDASGNATWGYGSKVAFAVTSSQWTYGSDGDIFHPIDYDNQLYDLGGNISLTTDKFVAPYDGIYHFDATIKADPNNFLNGGDTWYSISLWRNDVKKAESYSQVYVTVTANLSMDIKLDKNDQINTKVYFGSLSFVDACWVYGGGTRNFFNGHLVTRLD